MATIEIWDSTTIALQRRGRSDILHEVVNDGFVLGTTIPTVALAGVMTGTARTAYTGATTIIGSADPQNPLLIYSKNISQLITISSGHVRFLNCMFTGGPGTFDTGQVNCRAAGVQRVTMERCSFNPAAPSYFLNAVIGHHMTLLRCHLQRVVDGVGSYNQYGPRTDNYVLGNLFEDCVRYDVDEAHVDGTHNDSVQHQGGEGLWVQGNMFNGYNFYENGDTPADIFIRTPQCVLVQENVSVGGIYYCNDIHITENWIKGYMTPFSIKTRSSNGTPYDAEVTNNTWLNSDQRDYGGTYHYYNIRLGTETTINGISYPTTGATADTYSNMYSTDAAVDSALRGVAVQIRRDSTPV